MNVDEEERVLMWMNNIESIEMLLLLFYI